VYVTTPGCEVVALDQQLQITHSGEILMARLSSAFAVLATLLAAVGLYGVTAFSVARRTPEFGVRIAFGATPSDILGLVVREVALLVLFGIGIGTLLSLGRGAPGIQWP